MSSNYYSHQDVVSRNIIDFMRQEGYSRLSLSKLTGVPRPMIDELLLGVGVDISESVYNTYMLQINQAFNLQEDYFLTSKETVTSPSSFIDSEEIVDNEKSEEVQELLFGLKCILDIYSMYIK
ncbi:hypothetical protein PaeCFBP13512_19740 [Paenibacillus sp. CFBP13512]|uniref:hypothetical protein n=1 Tax=Paenibacillus sp. CFBP13512 TaxID=2184007 RepID=UPI0010BF9ECF|nr:hypothetical protein [Paenibacillus sp. CFBP13512]TKJ86068.1 hypothetical protein PaeCFBP13512_19740 [Paenibacillus sp. CFBP13512]